MTTPAAELDLTTAERALILRALNRNDGSTLCPDWSPAEMDRLSRCLDAVRLFLMADDEQF